MKHFKLLLTLLSSMLIVSCQKTDPLSQLTSIEISSGDIELVVGDIEVLDVILNPDIDYPNIDIEWKSSDETVVTVSNSGVIKAIGVGEAYIDAKVKGTGISTFIKVTVSKKNITYKYVEILGVYIESIPLTNPETNKPWDEDGAPDIFVGIYDSMIVGTTFDSKMDNKTDFSNIPGWSISAGEISFLPNQNIQIRVFDADSEDSWLDSETIGNVNFKLSNYKGETIAKNSNDGITILLELNWVE